MANQLFMTLCMALSADPVLAEDALPRGTVLQASMITGGDPALRTQLIGQQLRRPIFAGREVALNDVEAPHVVTRQTSVRVEFQRNGLILSIPGRAMRSGAVGDFVPVLIEGRRQALRGRVEAPDLVVLP